MQAAALRKGSLLRPGPTVPPSGSPASRGHDARGGGGGGERAPEAYSHLESHCPSFVEIPVILLLPAHLPLCSPVADLSLFLSHIFLVCSYSLPIVLLPIPLAVPPAVPSRYSGSSEPKTGTLHHLLLSSRRVFGCLAIHRSVEKHTQFYSLGELGGGHSPHS